jgi:2-polyprenyl-3-methyl-5-hydroxy-6-metoxy-1,4-benzoquinol methylase
MRSKDETIESWRNDTLNDDLRRAECLKPFLTDKVVMDFGAGNGQFLELIKSKCKKVCGIELDEQTRSYLKGSEIDCYRSIDDIDRFDTLFDVITAFHVIEHLKDPIEFLRKMSSLLKTGGRIFLEFPNANDALLSRYESKEFSDFTHWSCHLMTFDEKTINDVIAKSNLKIVSMKQIQRYPLSNHMFWLSKGKPGGHNLWSFLNDPSIISSYERVLSDTKSCDTVFVEVST